MRGALIYGSIAAFTVGIFCRTAVSVPFPIIALLLFVDVLWAGYACIVRTSRCVEGAVALLFFLAGILRASIGIPEVPAVFVPLFSQSVILQGTVVADPDIRETTSRLTILVEWMGSSTKIIAVVPSYEPHVLGEHVQVSGLLEQPAPFSTDTGHIFAYDKFLAMNGVFGIVQPAHVEVRESPHGFLYAAWGALLSIKYTCIRSLSTALPQPYSSLAVGLIAGGKQGLGPDLLAAFTVAGLLPIVVLSGYNVMIVAEGMLRLLSRLPRTAALVIATLSIIAFVIAAGANSSAIRAGCMAVLALLARGTHRTYDVLRALCVALFLMILINPLIVTYDPGFQFSFAATLGLILLSPLLSVRMLWITFVGLREILATTLAAQIAVLPLLLWESGMLSLVAVPANMLVLPLVPLAMALSAIAAVVAWVVPSLGTLAGVPAYLCLWWIIHIAKEAAGLPLSHIIILPFSFAFVLASYAALLAIGVWLHQHPPATI